MMHERIQELSSQARDYASEYVADCKRYGYYMEHNEYDLRFEAKFAELIVKEYEQFLPEICPWANADEEGPMRGWHVCFVARKHFGFE